MIFQKEVVANGYEARLISRLNTHMNAKGVKGFASAGTVTGGGGLMGEAGPEAVVPLHRGSDGRLG